MKKFIKKAFLKVPILFTIFITAFICVIIALVYIGISLGTHNLSEVQDEVVRTFLFGFIIILPIILTIENIILISSKPIEGWPDKSILMWEFTSSIFGFLCTFYYMDFTNIEYKGFSEQLYNSEKHYPLSPEHILTFSVIIALSLIGLILLRVIKLQSFPPLCATLCIAAIYLGIIICVLWCIQIFTPDIEGVLLCLFPVNLIIIYLRTVKNTVLQKMEIDKSEEEKLMSKETESKNSLESLFLKASNWPWLALILTVPLLGVIVVLLLLFGQKPDSVIRMWTDTADWTMSTKIPPQNIYHDEHYLCTVAAGGHKNVVEPLRVGKRHGHRVLVNRQLCIANAFEQLLEERVPHLQRGLRALYDKTGYPIAKHIKSPYTADIIYFIMKPLEWFFLIVLYMCDKKPENRIAVQYPHSAPPIV